MWRLCTLAGLLLVLAACSGGEAQQTAGGSIIRWDRSPQTVVFRADVTSKDDVENFRTRNEVPPCTIYGDNRIVWTNDLGDFEVQVLWDKLSDQQIIDFVNYLTVVELIYNHGTGADLLPPSETAPVVETLSIFVNERQHVTDSFSDWEFDYFQRILNVCRTISQAPVLFEPQGAYVSARTVEYDSNVPTLLWNGSAAGLRLADLAERRWITDQNVKILWNIMRTSSPLMHFIDGDTPYQVALEVPGVTRSSPAAP